MRNLKMTAFVYILVGVSAALWVGIALATGVDFSRLWDFFKLLPKVISIDLLLVFVFTKWAWRWRLFQRWLVPFPDLNGTWEGHIQTTWKDPETGLQPGPIPTILTIKQSFARISCVVRTAEMTSYSYAEGFRIDRDRQLRQLAYSYTSKPRPGIADRSIPHEGTMLLNMVGDPATRLSGQYWTDRKSTGEATLRFRERKLADDLPEDLPTHPVSGSQQ